MALVVVEGLGHLLLGVQDKGTVLDDGLVERSTGNESKSSGLGSTSVNFKVDNLALRLKDNVVELLDNTALTVLANDDIALEGVGEGIPILRKGLSDLATRANGNIEDPNWGIGKVLY